MSTGVDLAIAYISAVDADAPVVDAGVAAVVEACWIMK